MNHLVDVVAALVSSLPAKIALVLAGLSALDKMLEVMAIGLTGKPQAAVKEADGFVEAVIGILQRASNWLAPRTSASQPPAPQSQSK